MADVKISALPAAASAAGANEFPINEAGTTKKVTGTQIATFIGAVTNVTASAPIASSGGATPNISLTGTVAIANGGTGQTTAPNAINALLPSQGGNSGRFLTSNGTVTSWSSFAPANTTLSNLGTTAINSDLIFNKANARLRTPDSASHTETLIIQTGTSSTTGSGQLVLITGNGAGHLGSPESGDISLTTGDAESATGNIGLTTGNALDTLGTGSISLTTGVAASTSGAISLVTGDSDTNDSGAIALGTGLSNSGIRGTITIDGSSVILPSTSGTAVLVGGTVTVSYTALNANSIVLVTSQVDGGTPGFLRITNRVNGTSFDILSSSGTDTSTVGWMVVEKV